MFHGLRAIHLSALYRSVIIVAFPDNSILIATLGMAVRIVLEIEVRGQMFLYTVGN